jgi:hypothetical protein
MTMHSFHTFIYIVAHCVLLTCVVLNVRKESGKAVGNEVSCVTETCYNAIHVFMYILSPPVFVFFVWGETEAASPRANLSSTNTTWTDLGSNPDHRGGKPAANLLSYGTALVQTRLSTPSHGCTFTAFYKKNWTKSCFIMLKSMYQRNGHEGPSWILS